MLNIRRLASKHTSTVKSISVNYDHNERLQRQGLSFQLIPVLCFRHSTRMPGPGPGRGTMQDISEPKRRLTEKLLR